MNKTKSSPSRLRLVVYISPKEHKAILKDAGSLNLKNEHRWAAMKLAPAIREAVERK